MSDAEYRLPTIMYHIVDDHLSGKNIVSCQRFFEHVSALQRSGYKTVALNEYIDIVRAQKQLSDKSVLVTFDDGYEDFYLHAWPILKAHNSTATVFLITSYVGQMNWWNCKAPYLKRHLSWEQILELFSYGISFGGHSANHHNLAKFDFDSIWQDVHSSKHELEDRLGHPVRAFCYPYGDYNDPALRVARELFEVTFSVTQGSFDYSLTTYAINRFDVSHPKFTPENLIKTLDRFWSNRLEE